MMQEKDFSNKVTEKQSDEIVKICDLLRGYEVCIKETLADFIASLCDVSVSDLLNDEKKLYSSQCRWLYWYAYRYMTNEPYAKMADRLAINGRKFTLQAINNGVNKMMQMAEEDTVWKKRWIMVKRIIKVYNDTTMTTMPQYTEPASVKVVIKKPSNVDVKVEFVNE
jgi:hypothetical protein